MRAATSDALLGLTSLLFVPGSRPDRFAGARDRGADMICIDLEDAVPPAGKEQARLDAIGALAPGVAVRINAVTTRAGLADLISLGDAAVLPELLLAPKIESPGELAVIRGALGEHVAIVPLIESPAGLRRAAAIANAPGVAALMFGGGDMAAELGTDLAWEPLLHARQAVVMACAEAGIPAIDVPWIALDDPAGLLNEAERARAIGFQAKAAIHPAQLAAIHAAMRPAPALVAEAHAALAAHAAAGGGAIRFEGRMLEAPIVRRYARVVAMSKRGQDNA